jgi:DNA mismatch repair protein MutL
VIRAVLDALGEAGYRASSTVAEDMLGAFRAPEMAEAAGPYATISVPGATPSDAFGATSP